MEVGKVKIAEDSDFNMLKKLIDDDNDWKLDYDKGSVKVSTEIIIIKFRSKSAVNILHRKLFTQTPNAHVFVFFGGKVNIKYKI